MIALGLDRDARRRSTRIVASCGTPRPTRPARVSAADALYLSGDRRAVPTLMEIAKSGYVMTGGGRRHPTCAPARRSRSSRIAGKETFDAFKALADKETEAQGVFGMALDRMQVAKECGDDIACYGKKLPDPSWTRAEKAAFAIGFSGNAKEGIPLLLAAMKPIAAMTAGALPGAPGDPVRAGAPRHQGLRGVRRQAATSRSSATKRRCASPARATCSARRA